MKIVTTLSTLAIAAAFLAGPALAADTNSGAVAKPAVQSKVTKHRGGTCAKSKCSKAAVKANKAKSAKP